MIFKLGDKVKFKHGSTVKEELWNTVGQIIKIKPLTTENLYYIQASNLKIYCAFGDVLELAKDEDFMKFQKNDKVRIRHFSIIDKRLWGKTGEIVEIVEEQQVKKYYIVKVENENFGMFETELDYPRQSKGENAV